MKIINVILLLISALTLNSQVGIINRIEPDSSGYDLLDTNFLNVRLDYLPKLHSKHIVIRGNDIILDLFINDENSVKAYVTSYIYKMKYRKKTSKDVCLYYQTLQTSKSYAQKVLNLVFSKSEINLVSQNTIEGWQNRIIHCDQLEISIITNQNSLIFKYGCISKQNQSIVPNNLKELNNLLLNDKEMDIADYKLNVVLEKGFTYSKDKYHLSRLID